MSGEWVDAPVGGVSYERDRGGSASDECGSVSFEHDQGQSPIVVDGHRVHQMVVQQLILSGGQLRISEVSLERDRRVVMGGCGNVPQTDVSFEHDGRVVVGGRDNVPQMDASCRVVGGRRGDVPQLDPRCDCGSVRFEPD